MNEVPGWVERLEVIAKYRKFLTRWFVLWIAIGVIAAFVWPPKYRAESSFMPPTEEGSGFFGAFSSSALKLSNVSDVEGGGFNAILTSKRLKDSLDVRFDFRKRYKVSALDKAYKAFSKQLDISTLTQEGIGLNQIYAYYIKVTDKKPEDAAAMANAVVQFTDEIVTEMTSRRQHLTRVFLEGRVTETKEALRIAEDSLRLFSQRTGIVAPEAQIEATISALGELEKQVAESEVTLNVTKTTLGDAHPRVKEIESRKLELEKQRDILAGKIDQSLSSNLIALKDSPELTLIFTRKFRNMRMQETLLTFLMQQLEQARIGEMRTGPVLHILDRAEPPETKQWPIKSLVVLLAIFLGAFSALLWVGWSEWNLAVKDTEFGNQFKQIISHFSPAALYKQLIGKE